MSVFEVASTQGKGYTATNAATGFKTNENLLKIPSAITLVTRDLIDDIGAADTSNILQYVGVATFFEGEALALRGNRIANSLQDEMPDNVPYLDNINVDSYTVLRGPAATLYLGAALSGTVMKTSKFPLQKPQYAVTTKINEHGTYRLEGDFTAPLATIGDFKFSYRLVMAKQGGEGFFKNVLDNRLVVHPALQMVYKKTVVRLAFDYQHLVHIPGAQGFVTPYGKLYTGAGRNESFYPPGAMEDFQRRGVRLMIIQKISDNWDAKIGATNWWFARLGPAVSKGVLDWAAQTIRPQQRRNDQKADAQIAQIDVNGKYQVFGRATQTTFGASYSDTIGVSRFWSAPLLGMTFPMNNPQMDLFKVVHPRDYVPPANPGNRTTTYRGNVYVQQTIDVIPDRLTLVAGLTRSKIKTNNVTNLRTMPPAVVVEGEQDLHRYGIVFNVTKDFVLYAMESTTFSPGANRDINLNILPDIEGKGQEVGFKTAFFDGRISSTVSFFKMDLTNQAIIGGNLPGGISYFKPIGATFQEGFDLDLAISPLPGLQFIGSYYNGDVTDQAGAFVSNTYTGQISLVGRYEFQGYTLRGLSFGAGFVRISGRKIEIIPTSYLNIPAGLGPLIPLEPGNLVNLFASYKVNKHWLLRVNIDNLLDEAFALGAQTLTVVDPSPPRTISVSTTYKF